MAVTKVSELSAGVEGVAPGAEGGEPEWRASSVLALGAPRRRHPSRSASGFWHSASEVLKSAGVGLLLCAVVASAIAGAEAPFFFTLITAWLLFPALVGSGSTLDAGCVFMLISAGVVVVVELVSNGPGFLLP